MTSVKRCPCFTFWSVWFGMVCVGGRVLRGLSGVWHWTGMPGSVSQLWFDFDLFFFRFFEEWIFASPILFVKKKSKLSSFCIRSCSIHHYSIVAHVPARSSVGKWSDIICAHLVFVCSLEELHMWIVHSVSLLSTSCLCFSVSFHVDWLLLLHPSILGHFSFVLSPSRSSFFLYDVYLTGRAANLFWLVSRCI